MKFPVDAVAPQLLNVLTGITPVSGPKPDRQDVRFVEQLRKAVNARLTKVGKALPGLHVPDDACADRFNQFLNVVSDLDQLAVGGRISLNEAQWNALVGRCVRDILSTYLNDPSREAI